jgi:hypothetical protein
MTTAARRKLYGAAVVALLAAIGTQAAAFAAADVSGAPDYSAALLVTGITLASFVGSVAVAYGKIRGLLDAKFSAIEDRLDKLEAGKVDVAVHDACQESVLRAVAEVALTSRSNGERLDRVLEALSVTGKEV